MPTAAGAVCNIAVHLPVVVVVAVVMVGPSKHVGGSDAWLMHNQLAKLKMVMVAQL